MPFNTVSYWAFFVIVLLVSGGLRGRVRLRVWFLTGASFYFYYAANGYLTLLIVCGTLFDFVAASRIEATTANIARKRWLAASITSNLVILGIFKYLNFVLLNGANVLSALGLRVSAPNFNLILPVGISFYTFEAISYVVDVYKRRFTARKQWRDFIYFIVFFPKLTAGPIIRPHHFFDEQDSDTPMTESEFERYFQMIFVGLIQKVVLADTMAPIADRVFGRMAAADSFTTLVGIYAFALQIYFDFVGYTNIAIGSAGLLGIKLPENFRRPYVATCLSDFWKRWHISLSTWLRDYLYIPIGGGRGGLLMICRNLMVTMTLGGLWHGASWNFAIWGALNGGLLCIERILGIEARTKAWLAGHGTSLRVAWAMVTFNMFALLWVPFRAHSLDEFVWVFRNLCSLAFPSEVRVEELVVVGLALVTIVLSVFDENLDLLERVSRLHPLVKAPAFAATVVIAFAFSTEGNQPFIYFRF